MRKQGLCMQQQAVVLGKIEAAAYVGCNIPHGDEAVINVWHVQAAQRADLYQQLYAETAGLLARQWLASGGYS